MPGCQRLTIGKFRTLLSTAVELCFPQLQNFAIDDFSA